METTWKEQTLETIEQRSWPEPDFDDHTGQRLYALWRTPLARFTVEDIRLLIAHKAALSHLVPLAIEKLGGNLFAEGDFYPGDLLQSVLTIDPEFWYANRPLWSSVYELIRYRDWELEERGIRADGFLELS
ncbi:contact-dependent growth inhibition system immunity protein [Tellurirhabdus rosea]|uniref:contact-dependent growth inhibition system immunity protein n=1 Tax=Tellurirhabdus rosea TaxID=2674997 RepID=UPI0022597A0F|nr:contact-dependent growth inhibition system immunity protein [Tellurirhabdus rosea]